MKYCAVIFLTFSLLSCMGSDKATTFNQLWSSIIKASSAEVERNAVDEMRQYLRSSEGSFSIYAVDKAGKLHDIQSGSATYKEIGVENYELHVEWNKSNNVGKGWQPKAVDNVYLFFLE